MYSKSCSIAHFNTILRFNDPKGLESRLEKTEIFWFIDHFEPADLIPVFIYRSDWFDGDIAVGLRIHAAGESEPHKFKCWIIMFPRFFIAPRRNNATFHRANSRIEIQLCSKRLRRKFILRNVRKKFLCVEKNSMPPNRFHHRNAKF